MSTLAAVPTHSTPIAYFITFTTYGSHLPGEPSTVNRRQNGYGELRPHTHAGLAADSAERLRNGEGILDRQMRIVAERAISEHCEFRGWVLHALNVRTNHVHVVVTAEDRPVSDVLGQLKARATRLFRESNLVGGEETIWARHGSTRMVWSEEDLVEAVDYVLYQQGAPMT